MAPGLSRREFLTHSSSTLGAGLLLPTLLPAEEAPPPAPGARGEPFGICLNTSTLRGHKLGIVKEVELAASTGYDGVEVWVNELDEYEKSGGSLEDLGKRIRDLGLKVPNAIAFPEWMVDDPERRAKALEDSRRTMERLKKIACAHVAAPPVGDVKGIDLLVAAERYRDLLQIGDQMGVIPAVEVWGFARNLYRLGQVAMVMMESGHPAACMVPDVYHLHKGGSGVTGIRHLQGASIAVFHVNDYPGKMPREELKDSHRVFPGDGDAPLGDLFRDLRLIGYRGMLSLELFNQDYYRRDAAQVAREGLEKTRAAVRVALG